jgi:hypothetical protein
MRRLVHHAAWTNARSTIVDFHVENSLARMDNQTETKEIELSHPQSVPNKQRHHSNAFASEMAVCGRSFQEKESDADL